MKKVDREQIRAEVRRALTEALEQGPEQTPSGPGIPNANPCTTIITEKDVNDRVQAGQNLEFPPGTRFTLLATELLERLERLDAARVFRAGDR